MSPRGEYGDRLADYVDVAERIVEFRAQYPEGRLRPVAPAEPYSIEVVDGQTYVVYAAACYRTPDDPLPGIGVAWEPVPGATPYTHDSELQNAETSAWGRAIVAALVADTKRGIATRDEVEARRSPSRNTGGAPRSAARMATLKSRAIALDADHVDIAGMRAEANLPTIARSNAAQLDAWEALLDAARASLEAPFSSDGDPALDHVVEVVSSALNATEVPPCLNDDETSSDGRTESPRSSSAPRSSPSSSDSPDAAETTTTQDATR